MTAQLWLPPSEAGIIKFSKVMREKILTWPWRESWIQTYLVRNEKRKKNGENVETGRAGVQQPAQVLVVGPVGVTLFYSQQSTRLDQIQNITDKLEWKISAPYCLLVS